MSIRPRTALEDRPVRVVVSNDKSDLQVRFDLFERLNTGGIRLSDQEVRECVYRGPFMERVIYLASTEQFKSVLRLPESRWKDGTPEDYALRFFAFLERYEEFDHSVKEFLNDFAQEALENPKISERTTIFDTTFAFLAHIFPNGLKTRKGMTPVNLFEAVSVGAALALKENPHIPPVTQANWVNSDALRSLTTGPTNSRPRVSGRIEFCRDRFLDAS